MPIQIGKRVFAAIAAGSVAIVAPESVLAQTYPHAEEPIGTVEQVYDGHLTPDLAVSTFRNIDRLFPVRVIEDGGCRAAARAE